MTQQFTLTLPPFPRGFHLITERIEEALARHKISQTGILHLFIQLIRASIRINENADASVRRDLQAFCQKLVPENTPYFTHTYEGPDDMPAHVLATLIGNHLCIPLANGRMLLGHWQGIYLGEHRQQASARTLIVTIGT